MLKHYEHTPSNPQGFWCSVCDHNQVDSNNKETGKFFVAHGHAFNAESKEYDGDYHGVMFAVCPNCLLGEKV